MGRAILFRFATVFGLLALLICGLTFFLLKRRLKLSPTGNKLLLAFFTFVAILMTVCPLIYRSLTNNFDSRLHDFVQFSQYFLMGWVGMTLLTLLALETFQLLTSLALRQFDPTKRMFLTQGFTRGLVAGTSLAAIGGYVQARLGPNIFPVTINLKTLPKEFDGLRLAQISDLHLGPLIHQKYLDHVVDQVLELDADIILLTGDLVDGTVEQLKHQIEPLLRLKARDGIYFCTGNHEYYSGAEEWIAFFESHGIHVFKNSNKILTRKATDGTDSKLMLAGIFDIHGDRFYESHRSDPQKAAQTTEAVDCKVLLAHNPLSIDGAAAAGFDLQVSGHTHAGQFYPFVWVVQLVLKHVHGLYQINSKTQLYVNQGTGYWGPPNRLGKSSEITHFTLRKA